MPLTLSSSARCSGTHDIWAPRLGKNIGYVWVPFGLSKPGTATEIEAPDGGLWPATTATIPFIDPRKDTPKS